MLESDKASMEIPATAAGTVVEVLVKEGDQLAEGSPIVVVEIGAADAPAEPAAEPEPSAESEPAEPQPEPVEETAAEPEPVAVQNAKESSSLKDIVIPDIGTEEAVEVIELLVAVGDSVTEGDSLLVLESDKASMEIPAPFTGVIESLSVAVGNEVVQDAVIGTMTVSGGSAPAPVEPQPARNAGARATV